MTGELCAKKFKKLIKNKEGLIIDEVSMVPLDIYRILVKLPKEFKIYLFGDFRQIQPIEENDINYENSELLKQLVNGNQIILRKQCRADAEFANECVQAFDTNKWDELLSGLQPRQDQTELNIVKTNLCRVFINSTMIKERATRDLETRRKQSTAPKYQVGSLDITQKQRAWGVAESPRKLGGEFPYIYKGLPIIANETVQGIKCDLYNGEQYVIDTILNDRIFILKRKLVLDFKAKGMWITYAQLSAHFSPGYAITVNKIQGATIDIPHSIWEFEAMDRYAKYTALTRTKNKKLISFRSFSFNFENILNLNSGKKAFIYEITDGHKSYIGSTPRSIEERWKEHVSVYQNSNWRVHRYMRKQGAENFKIKKICEFDYASQSHIRQVESYFIQLHDTRLNQRDPETNRPIFQC
jgi:ATP-dependent exoDNAse (exonuclease V) alpha subunit